LNIKIPDDYKKR